jgi:hypothetical protein
MKGGLADGKPDSAFPASAIAKGMKVESEHTNNPELKKEITKDHLEENKRYYDYLEDMEKKMKKTAFEKGFEKQAFLLAGIGGLTPKGKESNKVKAEVSADLAADAIKARKKHLGEYLLNPAVPGPVSEALDRLSRRHYAAEVDHPILSNLIPLYGTIKGGPVGKDKIEAAKKGN